MVGTGGGQCHVRHAPELFCVTGSLLYQCTGTTGWPWLSHPSIEMHSLGVNPVLSHVLKADTNRRHISLDLNRHTIHTRSAHQLAPRQEMTVDDLSAPRSTQSPL